MGGILDELEEYEIVEDVQVLLPRKRRLGGSKGFVFKVDAFGSTHAVELKPLLDLFSENYKHLAVDAQGSLKEIEEDKDCLFKGENATVSLCGGSVMAHLPTEDGSDVLHIRPLEGGSRHVVFRERSLKETEPGLCGLDDHSIETFRAFEKEGLGKVASSRTANRSSGDLYIELLILNDSARYQEHRRLVHAHSAFIASKVNDLFSSFPGDFKIKILLTGMLTFHEKDGWRTEVANNGQSIDVKTLLEESTAWVDTNIGKLPRFDLAHVLSGNDFYSSERNADSVIGLAWVGGWCTLSKNMGVTQATFASTQYVAITMAHEMMHGLGAEHTDSEAPYSKTKCESSETSYVMDPRSRSLQPSWSTCSKEWLESQINLGYGACTFAYPPLLWSSRPQCGNGLVEDNEECDCPLNDPSCDLCCDVTTCKLKPDAMCSARDGCCNPNTCTLRTKEENFVCRAAQNAECDTLEVCDGVSKSCPVNLVAPAGTACSGGEGTCYFGECHVRDQQCQKEGFPKACSDGCGSLFCENSQERCFDITPYVVSDGTRCADGLCYQGKCIEASLLPDPAMMATCSNQVLDEGETDLDCGGPLCPPCYAGQTCKAGGDCIYPSFCNTTTLVCEDVLGSGVSDPSGANQSFFEQVKEWVEQDYVRAIGVGVSSLVVLMVLIFFCCCSAGKKKRQDGAASQERTPSYRVGGKVVSPLYVAEERERIRRSLPQSTGSESTSQRASLRSERPSSKRYSSSRRSSHSSGSRVRSIPHDLSVYLSAHVPLAVPVEGEDSANRNSLRMSSRSRQRHSARAARESQRRSVQSRNSTPRRPISVVVEEDNDDEEEREEDVERERERERERDSRHANVEELIRELDKIEEQSMASSRTGPPTLRRLETAPQEEEDDEEFDLADFDDFDYYGGRGGRGSNDEDDEFDDMDLDAHPFSSVDLGEFGDQFEMSNPQHEER